MTPARPKRSDDAIVAAAAKRLAAEVKEWLNDESTLEEIEADLVKAIKYDNDGYDIARRLDGQYSPDAALVEILDNASHFKSSAQTKAEIEWVNANNITPPAIGSKVTYKEHGYDGKLISGEVTENHREGKSTIFCASLGHVKSGTGTHGFIVEWERLTIEVA